MLLAIDELITKRDILKEYIIYFNFEDERVQFGPAQLDLILQAWQTSLEMDGHQVTLFPFIQVIILV